jgi:hypothetical protein
MILPNRRKLTSKLLYIARGKKTGMDVIFNWRHWDQIWKLRISMSMPILITIHNHPLESEGKWEYCWIDFITILPIKLQIIIERRVRFRRDKKLMPSENPPKILGTADNIEWQFLQTLPDYGKMQKFRVKNQCKGQSEDANWCRIRYPCYRKRNNNCQFLLLALKTAKQCYHIYKHGEHNHPPVKSWSSSKCGILDKI